MAVAFRASSSSGNSAENNTVSVSRPTGTTTDDIVLCFLSRWGNSEAVTPPTGFTLVTTVTSDDDRVSIYWKRAEVGDSTTLTFSWTTSAWHDLHVMSFSGAVTSGVPYNTYNTAIGSGSAAPTVSVTTTAVNSMLAWYSYNSSPSTARTAPTAPGSFTLATNYDCAGAGYYLDSGSGARSISGSTDNAGSTSRIAAVFAITPQDGGSGTNATVSAITVSPTLAIGQAVVATGGSVSISAVNVSRAVAIASPTVSAGNAVNANISATTVSRSVSIAPAVAGVSSSTVPGAPTVNGVNAVTSVVNWTHASTGTQTKYQLRYRQGGSATWITLPEISDPYQQGMLSLTPNPTTEVNTTGWDGTNTVFGIFTATTFSRTSLRSTRGSANSLEVNLPTTHTGTAEKAWVAQWCTTIAGTTYEMVADVWLSAGAPDLYLEPIFKWGNYTYTNATEREKWLTIRRKFDADDTSVLAGISTVSYDRLNQVQKVWIDNFYVRPILTEGVWEVAVRTSNSAGWSTWSNTFEFYAEGEIPAYTITELRYRFIEPQTIITRKVEILKADGTTLWDDNAGNKSRLISGGISVDYGRDERRSADLELANFDDALVHKPEGFWYDKVLRLSRGIEFYDRAGLRRYEVPLGLFLIDRISRSRFPKTVKVTARDFTKKCLLSKFTQATGFAATDSVETVISAIAGAAGIANRIIPATGKTLGIAYFFERGKSRWEAMKEIATAFGYELFFDPNGFLVMRPFVDPTTGIVSHKFEVGPVVGNLVDWSKSANDTRIFNHISVIGATNADIPVWADAYNTNPNSPTNIARLGDRVDLYESALVTTTQQAQDLANAFLKIASLEEYEINFSSIVAPWLEAGEIVQFDDPEREVGSVEPNRFLLTNFNIPMGLEPMQAVGRRITNVG